MEGGGSEGFFLLVGFGTQVHFEAQHVPSPDRFLSFLLCDRAAKRRYAHPPSSARCVSQRAPEMTPGYVYPVAARYLLAPPATELRAGHGMCLPAGQCRGSGVHLTPENDLMSVSPNSPRLIVPIDRGRLA